MRNILLNNGWTFVHEDMLVKDCCVPFSMYTALLREGYIDDPFDRDNEYAIAALSNTDSTASLLFTVDEAVVTETVQRLSFLCADTVIDVTLNGVSLGQMSDMHRRYDFDVKGILSAGENRLDLHFHSSVEYTKKLNDGFRKMGMEHLGGGHARLRKTASMNGWDWGPRLPDMGLYKDVILTCYSDGELLDFEVRQRHENGVAILLFAAETVVFGKSEVCVTVTSPDGEETVCVLDETGKGQLAIDNPKLWWPNGYGEHPLYTVSATLSVNGKKADSRTLRVGLRTVALHTENDEWGKEFVFDVNGVRIFAMGGNYIPEDSLIPRITPETSARLIDSCILANYNMLRVWGGGYYLPDWFMDQCDECGLLIWHDFMFACSAYLLTDELRENIVVEAEQQLKRLRHHACLALMCGNNEIEQVFVDYRVKDNERAVADYIELFEHILPDAMTAYAPDIPYWPSSPSSGELFVDTGNPNKGDVHNWDVWHGSRPFREYRRHHFRFCSEYGFEAFPNVKTIESFTREEERNPFCRIMESHQKCWGGNGKILMYLSQTYLYPKTMENLVYASQLLQGEAIRYGVEHFRRNRGRCMGSLYWQLNDCWPTSSWSSIDYFGRWKGLHYAARNFYAPILLSAHEGREEVVLNLANETMSPFVGKAVYGVFDKQNRPLMRGEIDLNVPALSSMDVKELDLSELLRGHEYDRYFGYRLYDETGTLISQSSTLFRPAKHFDFDDPRITVSVREEAGAFFVDLRARSYAKGVYVDFDGFDAILSDNYFDLIADGRYTVKILRCGEPLTVEKIKKAISVKSVYDMDKD